MICINCPLGCHLTIEKHEDIIEVSGNTCPRGKQYAINELTNPTRTLTTTIRIKMQSMNVCQSYQANPYQKTKYLQY